LGHGTIGGKVTSGFYQGEEAAKIALKILNGSPLEAIHQVSESPNKYMFDYTQLKNFKIIPNVLPDGSILINEDYSFFQKYKKLVMVTGVAFLFLITIISLLSIIINQKRKNEIKLNNSYEELSAVYEELTAAEEELRAQYEELQENEEMIRNNEEQIRQIAYFDEVTSLPNRHYFMQKFKEILNSNSLYNKSSALIFLDLDEFKRINDTLGHDKGDYLLKEFAIRLKATIPTNSIAGRFGGDEFLILVPEFDNIKELEVICSNLLNMLKEPFIIDYSLNCVTTSIGISIAPIDGEKTEVLLKNADTAMYMAKEQGKNQYCFFSYSMGEDLLKKITIENKLRNALENEEFELYYQPQINLFNGKIEGMEVLIRWNNEELGFVPPNTFIPIAEKTGLIVPICKWVLETACKQNKLWLDRGLSYNSIAINVSCIQFIRPNFLDNVKDILTSEKLPSNFLDIEITEGLLMDSTEDNINKLKNLKAMGVKISLDDFGTGYSSLNYLRQLPVDVLKIDKSLVQEICDKIDQRLIVEVIIELSHKLGYKVIAEGVETKEQLKLLKEMCCDIGQGYYFSKPVTAEKIEALLMSNEKTTYDTI
jgi:diguanylate cyclase (GGDEF)-like protein